MGSKFSVLYNICYSAFRTMIFKWMQGDDRPAALIDAPSDNEDNTSDVDLEKGITEFELEEMLNAPTPPMDVFKLIPRMETNTKIDLGFVSKCIVDLEKTVLTKTYDKVEKEVVPNGVLEKEEEQEPLSMASSVEVVTAPPSMMASRVDTEPELVDLSDLIYSDLVKLQESWE